VVGKEHAKKDIGRPIVHCIYLTVLCRLFFFCVVFLFRYSTGEQRAKKDMAAATDPMEIAVQNGRQLALKVRSFAFTTVLFTTIVLAFRFRRGDCCADWAATGPQGACMHLHLPFAHDVCRTTIIIRSVNNYCDRVELAAPNGQQVCFCALAVPSCPHERQASANCVRALLCSCVPLRTSGQRQLRVRLHGRHGGAAAVPAHRLQRHLLRPRAGESCKASEGSLNLPLLSTSQKLS
jgi:hypothetical protein